MSAPRILIVDDQRDVRRILRTSLELTGHGYTVIEVPSGEEALIELNRDPVNLLVTDLLLPGMSGLELLERYRQLNPRARAIVITGHPTEEARTRAEELGVLAFFQKPIGTTYFLEAVERALALQEDNEAQRKMEVDLSPDLAEILHRVRHTLSAVSIMLLDEHGQVLVQSGDINVPDLKKALASIAEAFSAGLKASSLMGSLLPGNIQYFGGDEHDLYLTNVDASHGLLIVLRSGQAATRMGAVVHYGRQAADSIKVILASMRQGELAQYASAVESKPEWQEYQMAEAASEEIDEAETRKDWTGSALKADDSQKLREDADEYWGKASDDTSDFEHEDIMTFKEARDKGLVTDDPETIY
ncbi:MAG: response regulator [Anaerolineales bacterium]|nr:response regulator [Anaerolineales bacterium]